MLDSSVSVNVFFEPRHDSLLRFTAGCTCSVVQVELSIVQAKVGCEHHADHGLSVEVLFQQSPRAEISRFSKTV